jgi:hypothetical protein
MPELGVCFQPGCSLPAVAMIGNEDVYTFACNEHQQVAAEYIEHLELDHEDDR